MHYRNILGALSQNLRFSGWAVRAFDEPKRKAHKGATPISPPHPFAAATVFGITACGIG